MDTKTTPDEYECSICGKKHKRFIEDDDGFKIVICPLINEKIRKYRYSKKKNYLCANIFLECYKRKINFFDLMYEMGYLTEMLMDRNYYGGRTILNAEMVIDYFAMELGCSPKDFVKNYNDTVAELLNLNWGWGYDDIFVDENVVGFYYLIDVAETKYQSSDILFLGSPKGGDTHLLATKEKEDQGNVIYRLYLGSPCLYIQGRDCYSHNINWLQLGIYGDILLAEEYDGKLAEKIENELESNWTAFAEEVPADDVRFKIWIDRLKRQTIDNRLYWECWNNHYQTEYDNNTFLLAMNRKSSIIEAGDSITTEEKIYHVFFIRFDKEASLKFNVPIETEQATDLLSLKSVIKNSVACLSQALQQFELKERNITFADVLVVNSSIHCKNLQHNIVPYHGIVNILTKDNREEEYHIYVGYCKECRTYIVFKSDYNEMLKKGEPLCIVWGDNRNKSDKNHSTFIYKSQSILAKKGYNVQASVNLSDEERQHILKDCIDSNLVQIHDLLDFLNWLIKTREPMPNLQNAIAKWKRDIAFVTEYKKEERDSVVVKSITVK